MHSEVFTPHPLMPSKFEKTGPSRKARNLLQSDEQCPGAPLSHLRWSGANFWHQFRAGP